MNAYELADQLDNVKYQNGAKPFEMYANMLRQQADRIAELEKQTKPLDYEEICEIWKKLWQGGNIGHIAYTYARAIEERHGIK